jgi:hypothetical protein
LNNPSFVTVVTINGTHGEAGFGGVAAAPVFRAIAAEALRVMDVPKELPDELPSKTMTARAEFSDLADADGADPILDDEDQDDPPVPAGAPFPLAPKPDGPLVPSFRGLSMRAALAEAAAKGITILPEGSGIARVQSPPAGAVLHEGERIRVQFSR